MRLPEIPQALLQRIESSGPDQTGRKPEGWVEKECIGAVMGERNTALTKAAGRYISKGLSREETLLALTALNSTFNPPLSGREVIGIYESVLKTHKRNNPKPQNKGPLPGEIESVSLLSFNLTDSGNAECFFERNKDSFVFVEEPDEWRRTENGKWKNADREAVIEMRDTMREKGRQALEFLSDVEKIKPIVKHCLSSESNQRINAALNLAKAAMYVSNSIFDADPHVFGCANGAIDLRTGELFQPKKEDWVFKSSPVEYHPDEPCPMWLDHLNKVMGGNINLIGFLRRWFGYCLTGSTDERCMAIFHGTGANGKTITVETVSFIMGDYARRTRAETILVKHEAGVSNEIADLVGARFVFSSEAEQDKRLAESLVKDLTGGDSISTRKLYQEYFTFKPQFKMVLSTNHKPVIYGTDNAIWDRIRLVPFTVTIPEAERRPIHEMMGMFQDEAPGILAWMVKGCLEWLEKGLQTPEEVRGPRLTSIDQIWTCYRTS
jgi:putative DNA primase/helicase